MLVIHKTQALVEHGIEKIAALINFHILVMFRRIRMVYKLQQQEICRTISTDISAKQWQLHIWWHFISSDCCFQTSMSPKLCLIVVHNAIKSNTNFLCYQIYTYTKSQHWSVRTAECAAVEITQQYDQEPLSSRAKTAHSNYLNIITGNYAGITSHQLSAFV